jgi:hypothetical protein
MGMMKFEVPHQLSRDEAKKRVGQLLDYWAQKYGVKSSWSGDRATINGKAMGLTINADLTVAEGKVGGEATDPGFLFREKAKKYLTQKFNAYLDPAGVKASQDDD